MIHLHLTPEAINQTRFTYSPLIELMMSYRVLHKTWPNDVPAHQRWVKEAKGALESVSLPLMDSLLLAPHYVPDFLTPTPDHFETDIECDLFNLVHTPHSLVRKYLGEGNLYCSEVDTLKPNWDDFAADPGAFLPRLADEMRVYWQKAIAPQWPGLLSVIEGDILFRARQLALDGTARLLNDLNPTAVFDGQALRLDKGRHLKSDSYHVIDTEGLHLIPSAFGDRSLMWQVTSDYKPMVIYGARGLGAWQQNQPALDASLELLLGAGRANVLQDLIDTPATTTELAHHLNLTASAVSQHLTILHRAGLVNPQRSGKRVYYQLSSKGTDLLRLFR